MYSQVEDLIETGKGIHKWKKRFKRDLKLSNISINCLSNILIQREEVTNNCVQREGKPNEKGTCKVAKIKRNKEIICKISCNGKNIAARQDLTYGRGGNHN